jgi:hypothetical protein
MQDRDLAERKVQCYKDIDRYEMLFPRVLLCLHCF